MAGSYDDAPSRRMAYDLDGTVVLRYDTGAATELSASIVTELNDEDNVKAFGIGSNDAAWVAFVFPELREIDGIFTAVYKATFASSFGAVQTSPDTTNGIDGTWTTRIADITDYESCYDNFRDEIVSMAVPGIKGVRVRFAQSADTSAGAMAIHLYGPISPAETPDRMLFLDTGSDPADEVFTKPLDFGDVPRGQTTTGEFKIKNNSGSLTINTIQVTAEALYLNAGGWFEFGDDQVNYQGTFAVGNLGPGATKLIYYKQIIPDGETLGVQTGRVKVSHASLS